MTSEELDRCEEAAIKRAEEAAYASTEGVKPEMQHQVYKAMRTYLCTGIRLMREEIENIK